jgi:hypothetical protein
LNVAFPVHAVTVAARMKEKTIERLLVRYFKFKLLPGWSN